MTHLDYCFARPLSTDVEKMSRGSYDRLIRAHFFEQVEPQIALRCLELIVALIVG